jgi:hypothetical protein
MHLPSFFSQGILDHNPIVAGMLLHRHAQTFSVEMDLANFIAQAGLELPSFQSQPPNLLGV